MGVAERVVRHRIVEHRATRPRVRGEHQVAQRLDERPLVVDPLVTSRLRQPSGAGHRLGPEALDRVPHGSVVVGRLHLLQLDPLGVPPLELGFHERGDVDVVHDEVADHPGDVHVDEPRVDDLQPAQVTVAEGRSGEVGPVEAGTSERSGLVVLSSHGALSPAPPPSGDTMFGFVAGLYPTDQPTLPEREGGIRDLG